jgi:hypothetical protein
VTLARIIAVALLIACSISACAAQQKTTTAEPLILFCSLDRPVIGKSGTVKATVTPDAKNTGDITYQWTASEGGFVVDGQATSSQASGSEVQWTPKGASPGAHQLKLAAQSSSERTGSCTLTVVVSATERGRQQASIQDLARAFLARDDLETIGYGLYSYLVIPDGCASSQAGTLHERCAIFVRQALLQIRDEKDMKAADVAPPSHLNITYLLVKRAIPSDTAADLDRRLDDQVSWILANYDYARCHKLLLLMKDPLSKPGPLVISTKEPVFYANAHPSGKNQKPPEQLYQDYSDVPLNIMPLWFDRFRSQSFQEKFWETGGLDSFAWGLRKYLAIAGLGLPAAEASVKAINPT